MLQRLYWIPERMTDSSREVTNESIVVSNRVGQYETLGAFLCEGVRPC